VRQLPDEAIELLAANGDGNPSLLLINVSEARPG